MKFTLLVAAALLLSGAVHVYGQVTATWPLSQTTGRTVTTTDPNLLARSELFTGSLRISGYSVPNSSQRIGFNAIPWPTSISDTLYVEYSVTPATGFDFYVDSIKLLLGQSGGGQMFATVRASTDTTFATYTEFWTSDPNPVAPAGAQTSLAFAPGFTVANGQRYFLRIYPWYGLPSTGKYICPQNVIISGFLVIPGDSLSASTTALNPFQNLAGSPSDAQTYTLTGSGLTTDVTITPPPEFEVSTDGGSTWHNNSSPAMLPQVGGTIPGQPLSVMARMNASVGGSLVRAAWRYVNRIHWNSAGFFLAF